jgi:hypothetical protein
VVRSSDCDRIETRERTSGNAPSRISARLTSNPPPDLPEWVTRPAGPFLKQFIPICIPPNGIWNLVIGGEKSPEESFLLYSMPQVFDSMNGIRKFLSARAGSVPSLAGGDLPNRVERHTILEDRC